MSNRQQFKCVDLIDKFNDTSRYFDDIFTIDNYEFAEHIPDIYPRELQLNMANPSDKETPFLDLNKVIGSNIHTSVYDKRGDFGFPIVIFPLLSGDVLRLPSYWIYISQLVRFARFCTSFFYFHSKHIQITSNFWHRVTEITSFEKRLWSSLSHTLNFCPNFVLYRFLNMYHKESLTRSSTVILSTNLGGSKPTRISSCRARKKWNAFDVFSMTQRPSRGL